MSCECAAETRPGRLRHPPGERLDRHRHDCAFAALVLSGQYIEAGDRGRMRVVAGDVIVHGAYESHLNAVARGGAEVLVLPWSGAIASSLGRVDDADAIARLAECDVDAAARLLASQWVDVPTAAADWVDCLAQDLQRDPDLNLRAWAGENALRPETLSRGFHRAYGITAAGFRTRSRVLKALAAIEGGDSLVKVASDHGFADQAHLSRSFRDLTGQAPTAWMAARAALRKRRPPPHER